MWQFLYFLPLPHQHGSLRPSFVPTGAPMGLRTGVQILKRALEEPLRQLAENAGHDGAVVVQDVRRLQKEQNNSKIGFDVLSEEYGDLVEKGIIDPAKVTRSGLENAASIAAMILTTEALITDIPEPEKAAPAPQMPEY